MTSNGARGGTHHPLVELMLARLREFVREPEALFWSFFFPIVMSVAMAIAFPSQGSRPVRVGVPPGAASEVLRKTLSANHGVIVRDVPADEELRQLREGDVHVIVRPGDPPVYHFDPDREESRIARLVVDDVLKRAAGRSDPWQAREDAIAIPGSRYVDWLIPGIVALGIMNNSMWSIGFMTVQMRLRKLLKRLAASPMQKWEFLLAQVLARLLFLGPEVAVPLVFGALAFGMPVRGSIVGIALVALSGALAFGSIGLMVGSRVRTLEAISGLMNLIMVPMWVLERRFLFLVQLSRGRSAADTRAAADRTGRRATSSGAGRRDAWWNSFRADDAGRVGHRALRDRPAYFQVAISGAL